MKYEHLEYYFNYPTPSYTKHLSHMDTITKFHETIYTSIINDPVVLKACFIKTNDPLEDVNMNTIKTYLLNILLVMCNCRETYRTNLPNTINKYLINKIMKLNDTITINNINEEEPFLFLKCNEQYIKQNLISDECIGTILGYPYVGPDWWSSKIDRYYINTILMPNDMESPNKMTRHLFEFGSNHEYYFLYSSLCPVNKFDNNVKNNILQTMDKFNNITINYGYKCITIIHLYPKESYPHFEINLFNELFNIQ